MNPTDHLPLLAAAAAPGAAARVRFHRLAGSLDPEQWPAVLDAAERHRLRPLLHRALQRTTGLVPFAAQESLAEAVRHDAVLALAALREGRAAAALLAEAGIASLALKGPVLACALHGDPALRAAGDFDLLVARRHAARAGALLADGGWACAVHLTPRMAASHLRTQHELPFRRGAAPVLELHWAVAQRHWAVPLAAEALLTRAQPAGPGEAFGQPSTEDRLLLACIHGARHRFATLDLLADVAGCVALGGIDWNRLWAEAERAGVRRIVAVALAVAERTMDARLPAAAGRPLSIDRTGGLLAARAAERLERGVGPVTGWRGLRAELLLRERRADRVRRLGRLALTPTAGDWGWVRLPDPLHPLYHALRPVRLLGVAWGRLRS
ncbi:MAG: nucleotidyltransferase family protein [Gemmatimonadota bacterium]